MHLYGRLFIGKKYFWNQKSHIDWIEIGDRNTTFYHTVAQCNRMRGFIRRLKLGDLDLWCEDQDTLRAHAEKYFKELFSSREHSVDLSLLE